MNIRKQWILHWAWQLKYINEEQKINLSKINLPYEDILKKMLTREKILHIRYMYILQRILLELAKNNHLTQAQCNEIMLQKINGAKHGNLSIPLSPEILKKVDVSGLKCIINELTTNETLENKDVSLVFKIFGNQEETFSHTSEQVSQKKATNSFPENKVEHYDILGKIGAGGMGVVYKAFDTMAKRIVAIKAIHGNKLGNEMAIKRFYREMEISSSLTHPNLLKIYHFGKINNIPYLVMEYVEGKELIAHLREGKTSFEKILHIIKEVSNALEYAHKKKILHRDIKPSNILIRKDGSPVLMDFGLAKKESITDKSLTQSGEILGTPQYMSPEQAKGQRHKIDHATDIYSLGAVLYHLLTGDPPAVGDTLINILHQVSNKKVTFSKELQKQIPAPIRHICCKALEKK